MPTTRAQAAMPTTRAQAAVSNDVYSSDDEDYAPSDATSSHGGSDTEDVEVDPQELEACSASRASPGSRLPFLDFVYKSGWVPTGENLAHLSSIKHSFNACLAGLADSQQKQALSAFVFALIQNESEARGVPVSGLLQAFQHEEPKLPDDWKQDPALQYIFRRQHIPSQTQEGCVRNAGEVDIRQFPSIALDETRTSDWLLQAQYAFQRKMMDIGAILRPPLASSDFERLVDLLFLAYNRWGLDRLKSLLEQEMADEIRVLLNMRTFTIEAGKETDQDLQTVAIIYSRLVQTNTRASLAYHVVRAYEAHTLYETYNVLLARLLSGDEVLARKLGVQVGFKRLTFVKAIYEYFRNRMGLSAICGKEKLRQMEMEGRACWTTVTELGWTATLMLPNSSYRQFGRIGSRRLMVYLKAFRCIAEDIVQTVTGIGDGILEDIVNAKQPPEVDLEDVVSFKDFADRVADVYPVRNTLRPVTDWSLYEAGFGLDSTEDAEEGYEAGPSSPCKRKAPESM